MNEDNDSRIYRVIGKKYGTRFCAGFVFYKSKVIMAAPIIKELIGKSSKEIAKMCSEHNWLVERVWRKDRT